MDQDTYDRGLAMRRKVLGEEYVDRALENVDDFNRDFQRIVTQYCWGEAWGDTTLTPRERSILNLGMIASLGKMEEFQTHVRGALQERAHPQRDPRGAHPDRGLLRHPGRGRLLPAGQEGAEREQGRVRPAQEGRTSRSPLPLPLVGPTRGRVGARCPGVARNGDPSSIKRSRRARLPAAWPSAKSHNRRIIKLLVIFAAYGLECALFVGDFGVAPRRDRGEGE